MTLSPLIQIENLDKSYVLPHGTVHALKNINLTIHAGESLAIMGPSGCGKSTLLHLLGCLDTPTQGNYFIQTQNIKHLNDKELSYLRATKIGFVFQSFNLIPQFNVFENLEIPFFYQSILPEKEIRQRIFSAIEQVHLQHRLYHLPSQLSGGEKQRVAIARALVIQPLVILADEPTGNLDTGTGLSILQLFQTLNNQGMTLVMVTHDRKASAHFQRIVEMKDGCLIKKTSIDSV